MDQLFGWVAAVVTTSAVLASALLVWRTRGLRRRLFLTLLGVALVPALTVGVVTWRETTGLGRLAVGDTGSVFGLDGAEGLWRFDPAEGKLHRGAVALPGGPGAWGAGHATWARDPAGLLYLADDQGRLFTLTESEGLAGPIGQTRFAPVGAMAVTPDGRLFGACGEGIARLFCYHRPTGQLDDLGCAVSVLQRRRYGYVFSAAATGRDGQLYFAENDDLGHLWIYFPRIPGS